MIWTPDGVPSLAGKTFIVTGANAGIGLATATVLAGKGARVIMACRNPAKAEGAVVQIKALYNRADISAEVLDLSSLESIKAFARKVLSETKSLDVLINNAGVMTPPYGTTADGFETQFGTNFLGHFLLTLLLLPTLNSTAGARVVTLSSVAHWTGRINFENLNAEKAYSKWNAYSQSKLANLIFAVELQRRLSKAGASTLSIGAHPGVTASELTRHSKVLKIVQGLISQSTMQGAMPSLRAALDPEVKGGEYYGPGGVWKLSLTGDARRQISSPKAHNQAVGTRLWEVAEALTGCHYP
jgi:NAD(P)-dependent dehydrogenase (short-subunit alcohol dehydrogenase family)